MGMLIPIMAFQVSISSMPRDEYEPCWIKRFVPWNEQRLREDPRFRQVYRCPGYADYYAVMTCEEAMQLHLAHRDRDATHHRLTLLEAIPSLLASTRSGMVVVGVHEWESGLG